MLGSTVLTFTDPYEYASSVRAADQKIFPTTRGAFAAKLTRIDLHRLWVQRYWLSLPTVVHSAVHKERNPIWFLVDASQRPMIHSGVEIHPGEIGFHAPAVENHRRLGANSHWGSMSLTPEDLAEYGRSLVGRELAAPALTRVIRPSPAPMVRLLTLHKAAADLAATAPDILAHPEVSRAVEQELVRAMIACLTEQGAETRDIGRHRGTVVQRFERLLEVRQDQPLYITDVCREIGVTDRTLRLHCQEHLGMSPHRYLWLRRMNLARRALVLADGTARTVTEIANDHGFGELGRFAGNYRELFGESPSATLRRAPDDRSFGRGQTGRISDSA